MFYTTWRLSVWFEHEKPTMRIEMNPPFFVECVYYECYIVGSCFQTKKEKGKREKGKVIVVLVRYCEFLFLSVGEV